ncbi:MAG TPA: hypothetical protein VFJ12_03815 [Segeticoccus sp.]|nr:hypothetical protein [Segeticoccus sp.]
MFTRRSKAEKVGEQAQATAVKTGHQVTDTVREHVAPALAEGTVAAKEWGKPRAEAAYEWSKPRAEAAAKAAKDWGKPRAEAAYEWSKPRAEAAYEWSRPRLEHQIETAAPKLEQAVAAAGPAVDTARDKIVDDLLPKVQAALHELSEGKGDVARRSSAAAAVLSDGQVGRKRRGKGGIVLIVLGVLAGTGAAVAAYLKKSQAKEDPWATPPAEPYVPPATTSGVTTTTATATGTATSGAAGSGLATELDGAPGTGTAASDATGAVSPADAQDIRDVDVDALGKDTPDSNVTADDLDSDLDEGDVTRHRNRNGDN